VKCPKFLTIPTTDNKLRTRPRPLKGYNTGNESQAVSHENPTSDNRQAAQAAGRRRVIGRKVETCGVGAAPSCCGIHRGTAMLR
jgi:hypothetical protein